jgi:hypothetical protein
MNPHEVWQIEVQDRIYEAEIEEVIEWIKEGAVLPEDKIRKGNLRWLAAGRVPEFYKYFRKNSNETDSDEDSTIELGEIDALPQIERNGWTENELKAALQPADPDNDTDLDGTANMPSAEQGLTAEGMKYCTTHPGNLTRFVCNICSSPFCGTCPNRFGSTRLCPLCGGVCVSHEEFEDVSRTQGALNKPYARKTIDTDEKKKNPSDKKLRLLDIVDAIKYPFTFPADLVLCVVLFVIFYFGQSLFLLGGMMTVATALGSGLVSTMFNFGILTKILSNFTRGDFRESFRPHFHRQAFSGHFLRPFFLGVAVYLASFGLFFAMTGAAGIYAWYQFSSSLDTVEAVMREERTNLDAKLRAVQISKRSTNIDELVTNSRRDLINSAFGSDYFGENRQIEKVVKSFMSLSVALLTPIFLAFLFGIVYFPAASSIAIKSDSFRETLRFSKGLREIKEFGFEYVKIVFISLMFLTLIISTSLEAFFILSNLSLPLVGAASALILGGTLSFFCWTAFSYLLAITVHRRMVLSI